MRNLFSLLFFISVSICALGQTMDCKKFRDGTFKTLPQEGIPETTITRKGSKQIEKVEGRKGHSETVVEWIDDCTYTLTPTKETLKNRPGMPENAVFTIKIVEVKENSYVQITSCNFADFKATIEIFKVK